MLIIIEGCDCTGKSSLAEYLSGKFRTMKYHFSKPKGKAYDEYIEFIEELNCDMVVDRYYLGEEVYGPVWRGKSSLTPWEFMDIEHKLTPFRPLGIFCHTDVESIISGFKTRGEALTKPEEVPQIVSLFEAAVKKSKFKWLRFDYRSDRDYLKITNAIEEFYF